MGSGLSELELGSGELGSLNSDVQKVCLYSLVV